MRSAGVDQVLAPTLCAVILAAVHLSIGRLHFLGGTPRSMWLSAAGGVAVAYVFVHLLPELAEGQETMSEALAIGFVERHVYLVAMAGLLVFYGLDRGVKKARSDRTPATVTAGRAREDRRAPDASRRVFWLHIGSFALYSALVGYLLAHREDASAMGLAFYTVAIALHLLVTDFGLEADHRRLFHDKGRWVLAAAVLAGWLTGILTAVDPALLAALTAFLGGGVILNVLKEEVPSEQQSRFWAFAAGALAYSALLLAG